MFKRMAKSIAVACALIGFGALSTDALTAAKLEPQLPVRSVEVTLRNDTRHEFFNWIRKLADRNAFAIRIAPVHPDQKHFIIEMWREDIKILAVNSFDPVVFKFGFYRNGPELVSMPTFDLLVSELRRVVGDIPGSAFSEAK